MSLSPETQPPHYHLPEYKPEKTEKKETIDKNKFHKERRRWFSMDNPVIAVIALFIVALLGYYFLH